MLKTNRGFTIIELLVVLSIITVLFSIVVPIFHSVSEKVELDYLAKQIRTDLYWAQNEAIATGAQMSIYFPTEANFYYLRRGINIIKVVDFDHRFWIALHSNYTTQTITFNNKGSVVGGDLYVKSKSGKNIRLVLQVTSGRIRVEPV